MARLGLLMELLERRGIEYYEGKEDIELNELITFLCVNQFSIYILLLMWAECVPDKQPYAMHRYLGIVFEF